eukprot:SM000054S18116  [mRNA]  locus=s54:562759:563797:- [translate_table: standard]
MVPLEVIRSRQMVQQSGEGAYTGSMHAARSILQHEGVGALYRGFMLAQMVWGPYNAIYLPLWEATKQAAVRCTGVKSKKDLKIQWELLSSLSSAAFAAGITNPMDVVKTRLQVQGKSNTSGGGGTQYTGAWHCARSIWQQEGLRGFTTGMTSRMLWVGPSGMIMFTTFDQLMKRLTQA